MKKYLYIFYIVQEWKSCNRKPLILELAKQVPDADFVCINRPADLFVSPWRHPYRISEALEKGFYQVASNVYVMRPFFLLHDQMAGKTLNQINGLLLRWQLEHRGVRLQQYDRVIQWVYLPSFYQVSSAVCQRSNTVFELFDEIGLTPWDTVDKEANDERLVLTKSDLIFTLTDYIAQKRQSFIDKIIVIGNGVDYELFSKALGFKEKPDDLKEIPGPVIGLFGIIRNWIDFEMLQEMIQARPNWSFVMVGPVEPDVKVKLDAIASPNLHVLGQKNQEDLYKYLAFVDVGIIPYLQSEFIRASRPLKMFEYLAAGIPVVSVPVDCGNLAEIDGAIYIGKNAAEFVQKVERALSQKDKPVCQSIAQKNTWNEVALKVLETCKAKWGINYG